MVRFRNKNRKEEIFKDELEDEELTDDEIDALASMIVLGLVDSPVDCGDCPGDAGCC